MSFCTLLLETGLARAIMLSRNMVGSALVPSGMSHHLLRPPRALQIDHPGGQAAVTELPAACTYPAILQHPASPDPAPGNPHVVLKCLKWEKVVYRRCDTQFGSQLTVVALQLTNSKKLKKKSSSTRRIYVCALKKTVAIELQLYNTLRTWTFQITAYLKPLFQVKVLFPYVWN